MMKALFTPDGKLMLLGGSAGIAMWSVTGTELCWEDADKHITAVTVSNLMQGACQGWGSFIL